MSSFDNILKSYEENTAAKRRKISNDSADSTSSTADILSHKLNDNTGNLRLPAFFVIGAQKAGTMAAVKNLNKHPDIFVANEVHYFDLGWHTKDVAWYSSFFDSSKPILGEKTPELIYVDECAIRMKEVCPDAKFILFLRDPIARAYSSWNMNVSKNREGAPFDECVQRNLNNLEEFRSYGTGEFHYVQRGFYLDQIERFLAVFPNRDNMLVVVAEHARSDPTTEYNKIFKFLGAKPFEFSPEEDHVGTYAADMNPKVVDKLRKVYKSHNERLFKFLGYRIPEWEADYVSCKAPTSALQAVDATESKSTDAADPASAVITTCSSSTASSVRKSGTTAARKTADCPLSGSKADFAVLGKKHGTDKVTHHGYNRFYPRFIDQYRSLPNAAMLEIGVDQSHSLNMWLEYFPLAFIYGVDISVSKTGDRFRIFQADQSRLGEMRTIVEKGLQHPLFLIVDDGSHIPEHQVQCFDYLFRTALMPGGCYIVEDIETSYWTRGGLYGYTTR